MSKNNVFIAKPKSHRKELLRVSDGDLEDLKEIKELSQKFIDESMENIRDWYNKQPHFPRAKIDDYLMLRYLACNKFSIERTKTKLENLITARSMITEFFSVRDPLNPRVSEAFNVLEWIAFPEPTPEKYRVIYVRLKPGYNMQKFDANMMYTLSIMFADILYATDAVRGDIYIWDFANMSLPLLTKLPPTLVKKAAYVMQQCYGHSIKGIHVLNCPSFAEFIFNTLKSYLPKKIAERCFIYSKLESIYEQIPRSIFPKDMGGDEPKTTTEIAESWRDAMESPEWRQWFLDTQNLKTDESKRMGKSPKASIFEDIGVVGSFRKLDLD